MSRLLAKKIGAGFTALACVLSVPLTSHGQKPESDKEVQAHRDILDLAGAFSNDGFKIRDGHWAGTLKPKDNVVVAVNLYAGNQYWFAVGAVEPAKKVDVAVYDETGKLMESENYQEGSRSAAGFSPTASGQYFISITLAEGEESSYCLVYSYK
jgi:hypothetical protein